MRDLSVVPVDADAIDGVWFLVKPMIQVVLESSQLSRLYGIEDIYIALVERKMQLWMLVEENTIIAVCTTQIVKYPKATVCKVGTLSCKDPVGNPINVAWDSLTGHIESWAHKVEGCDYIYVDGRMGWKRILKDSDYLFDSVILIKELV